jgi:hypothetical protein
MAADREEGLVTQGPTLEKKHPPDGVWVPETDAERSAIQQQLEKILANSLFKNSKRYPNMLRYVVEQALAHPTEHLKERTLGVEVFGRDPEYDTNLDPVVRITAGEIRKRIAQYYHEPGHETEIRIEFPPGSYLPEFHMPSLPAVEPPPVAARSVEQRKISPLLIGSVVCALVLAVILIRPWSSMAAIDRFWAPVLNSSEPISLYIGGYPTEIADDPELSLRDLQQAERVAFSDATALARVTSFLVSRSKPYRMRFQASGRLDDLKDGPSILIGAFNNSWTLRLTSQLRFGFLRSAENSMSWIQDRDNPGSREWSHVMTKPYATVKQDYAVVSRVVDPTTGRVVVMAAGLAKFGTAAAGEFLTSPSSMEQLNQAAPANWDRKNIEVVIATSVIGRSSGPSHVLAVHVW